VRLVILLSIVTLAFAAAGCGGGGGSSASGTKPETWATQVCGALQTWGNDLKSSSQQLETDIRTSTDVKSVKQKLVAFLQGAEQSSQTMVDKVQAAGAPAIDNGPTIQRDLESALGQASGSFHRAVAEAKKLPTNDPQALSAGLSNLAQSIQSELTATGQHFSELDTKHDLGDLKQAMANEPACKPFVSASG
jgi:hypothetical protein